MATTFRDRRAARLQRRLHELRAWRNDAEVAIPVWSATFPSGHRHELRLGDVWPEHDLPVIFESTCAIPTEWQGSPVDVELWLGGEAFVQLSTGFRGGLNPMHHRFPVTDAAAGGEIVSIVAEVVPKGIFGSNIAEPRIEHAKLVVPNRVVRAYERDLTMIAGACDALGDHEVVDLLFDAAEQSLSELSPSFPTGTEATVSRYVHGYASGIGSSTAALPSDWIGIDAVDNQRPTMPIWQLPDAEAVAPLDQAAVDAITRARTILASRLDTIKGIYPPVGRLCLTGHAHTDLAWLWPVAETRRKLRRTWWTVIDLMDRYPDFIFNQSSAQAYAWIEEDDPELFEQVKARVADGRWDPVGGSWVEPDANITGGESFVRQLLYGQHYFESRFGRRHAVAWLPDVFDYSGGLPQILRLAGIDGFFTIKLNWNEANDFPFDLFQWEGIDGSSVTAHTFSNPGHGYNGNIVPFDTLGTWRNFRGKTRHDESLFSFGWGDGAGGPTDRMLENYERIRDFPALPRLRMGKVEEFFASLPPDDLPNVVGELYLELHRGTLTTQARTKKLNRASEHRLFEAEVFSSIASLDGYHPPAGELEAAWKSLLLNQFHDILPGSSIAEVYIDTERELTEVIETATNLRDAALTHGADDAPELVVANASLSPRPLTALIPAELVTNLRPDFSTSGLITQTVDSGALITCPGAQVPGLSSSAVARSTPTRPIDSVSATTSDHGFTLENHQLLVLIGPDGAIHRLYDKSLDRDALADRANQLWAYVDKPYAWDAWDIDETYARDGEEIVTVHQLGIVESGPIRAAVRVERRWRDSRIEQTYRLYSDSKRLDIVTKVDWHERQVLLKTRMPLAIRSHQAAFETMYGAVYRPTHRNGPWDAARFEGCAH
ncbi:MAG: alpha-mannosidase, partial [Thermomicrobiales bacterium]|nr:alpha-mannosidase [Thermomicrobiales bacterium]